MAQTQCRYMDIYIYPLINWSSLISDCQSGQDPQISWNLFRPDFVNFRPRGCPYYGRIWDPLTHPPSESLEDNHLVNSLGKDEGTGSLTRFL